MATMAVEYSEGSFTWKIKGFSKLSEAMKDSEIFEIGGSRWQLNVYPQGDGRVDRKDHLSLYLAVADTDALPEGWAVSASYTLIVHHKSEDPEKRSGSVRFTNDNPRLFSWGYAKFMKLDKLKDAENGFLVEDTITVEAQVKVKQDILEHFTKNDGVWSLCLQFDGALMESSSQESEKSDLNKNEWVSLKDDAKQRSACLYLDAGFMSRHSKLIKEFIEEMNLSAVSENDKRPQIVVPVPKEFCPGRCTLVDVQRALGHLYYPRDFPLQKYDSSMHKLLCVADYFQMRHLTLDIEDCLLNHIQKKLKSQSTDINHLMNLMQWSESYDLKRCWSALKKGLICDEVNIKSILNCKAFAKLSVHSQNDIMQKSLTTLLSLVGVSKQHI